jgi:hypothetical protein
MSQDYGIVISQPGQNASTATGNQILMNTANPFVKIDTQNANSFTTVTLSIVTDPPEPGGSHIDTFTTVYQFKHNYTYVPSIETLFVVTSPAPGQTSASYQAYFYDYGVVGSSLTGIDGDAEMYACADTTNVYYIIRKHNGDGASPVLLTGTNLSITTHVFAEDIGV